MNDQLYNDVKEGVMAELEQKMARQHSKMVDKLIDMRVDQLVHPIIEHDPDPDVYLASSDNALIQPAGDQQARWDQAAQEAINEVKSLLDDYHETVKPGGKIETFILKAARAVARACYLANHCGAKDIVVKSCTISKQEKLRDKQRIDPGDLIGALPIWQNQDTRSDIQDSRIKVLAEGLLYDAIVDYDDLLQRLDSYKDVASIHELREERGLIKHRKSNKDAEDDDEEEEEEEVVDENASPYHKFGGMYADPKEVVPHITAGVLTVRYNAFVKDDEPVLLEFDRFL